MEQKNETDLAVLLKRIETLESKQDDTDALAAIGALVSGYSHAIDWLDEQALDRIFFADARIDYGFFKGQWRDFRPILMDVERSFGRRWHFTAQTDIRRAGNVAWMRSYNLSISAEPVVAGPSTTVGCFAGYYIDRAECRDGRWGIRDRKHLLVTGFALRERTISGALSALNAIGVTQPDRLEYRAGIC